MLKILKKRFEAANEVIRIHKSKKGTDNAIAIRKKDKGMNNCLQITYT
jgi:hypothetical protein